MYLKLSTRPSDDWVQIFNAERRFPRHTMWRDALIEKDFIIILCVPEELEKIHLGDLKEDVLNANTKYRQYLFEQAQREVKEKDHEKTEIEKLQNLKKRLDFETALREYQREESERTSGGGGSVGGETYGQAAARLNAWDPYGDNRVVDRTSPGGNTGRTYSPTVRYGG